ncbi:MAG: CHRD domain-containing protein [Bacteroidota bacterium]|nr:CHRD domain-containing protein [Bacteroidota bacterium]
MKRLLFFICFLLFVGSPRASKAQILITAALDGATAGTTSNGKGTMWGVLSPDLKTLTYLITYQNLQGNFTQAHFHAAGGTVVEAIAFGVNNTASGVWSNIPDSLLGEFFSGNHIYVNIHSSTFPGGEIRGYLNPHQGGFIVALNGGGAGTSSMGLGTGWVTFDSDFQDSSFNKISYNFTYAGLEGSFTGAHFHSSLSTNVVEPIPFTDSSASGTIATMPDSVWALFIRGKIYVNVHSSVFPAGEIQGTLTPVGQIGLHASLDSSLAGTTSAATGTAWAALDLGTLNVHYSVTYAGLTGSFTMAHFHRKSGIVHGITFTGNTAEEEWSNLADQDLVDLILGRLYVNIHSSTFPGGEIRGTMISHDGVMMATLDGSQAGTTSTATGTAWLSFGDSLQYHATIAGLNGSYTAAHFHLSPQGTVLFATPFSDSTAFGYWNAPDSIGTLFVENRIYMNVHSSLNPGGEIRGNMHLGYGQVITGVKNPPRADAAAVPASFSLEQNYPNPFNPTTHVRFSISDFRLVVLTVYDILGRKIATLVNERKSPGTYDVTFDGSALASGVYLYRLQAGDYVRTKRMVVVK